jgi:hypothetical protein
MHTVRCAIASSWYNTHARKNLKVPGVPLRHVLLSKLSSTSDPAALSVVGILQYNCQCPDCEDTNVYPKGRFISEFGIQSYPTWETLSPAMGLADTYVDSGQMSWRQRKFLEAPSSVFNFVSQRFRLPADCKWPTAGGDTGGGGQLPAWSMYIRSCQFDILHRHVWTVHCHGVVATCRLLEPTTDSLDEWFRRVTVCVCVCVSCRECG